MSNKFCINMRDGITQGNRIHYFTVTYYHSESIAFKMRSVISREH